MAQLKINLPLVLWLPRKIMDDKRCPMNMNFYRNVHHITNNQLKKMFVDVIKSQHGGLCKFSKRITGPFRFTYTIYPERKSDVMNVGAVLDKYASDALIERGLIKDDNCMVVRELTFRFGGYDKENPRCELIVEEIE